MKTVFNDISSIAHIYANNSQEFARNSNNTFYFERNAIFSYGSHFCIANKVVNGNNEHAVLFTERTYSNTTSKHISVVRSAIYGNLIFCAYPLSKYGNTPIHEDNFKYWLTECEQIAKCLLKAKKPEKYLNEISYIKTKVEKYSNFFSLEIPLNLIAMFEIQSKENYIQFNEKRVIFEQKENERKQKEQFWQVKQNKKK